MFSTLARSNFASYIEVYTTLWLTLVFFDKIIN